MTCPSKPVTSHSCMRTGIIQFQLQGVPEPYLDSHGLLDELESGPVYHIVTPRVKNSAPVGQPFELRKLLPENSIYTDFDQINGAARHGGTDHNIGREQEFDRVLRHLDTFNRDVIELGPRLLKKQERSKAHLLGDMDTTILPPTLKVTLDRYADRYAIAASLAIYFKDRVGNTMFFLFSLFFVAVICFDIFAHLGDYLVTLFHVEWLPLLFLVFYLIFLFAAYIIWNNWANKRDYKNKYLDYRALAEGVRVQFFWRLAGVPDTVASHYLRKQKSELDWIRNSIRVSNLLCDVGNEEEHTDAPGSVLEDRYRLILQLWMNGQAEYFTRTTKQDHRKLERNEQWVHRFFVTGLALAGVLFLLQFFQLFPNYGEWIKMPLVELLIVVMSLVLVLAALREGYTDKMAYAEQVKQYQRMSHLFWLASQRLNNALEQGKPQDAECVIRELGEEALADNGDWVMLHRARPINVPMGG